MKKVVITDYQYSNIDVERKIVSDAGFELYDYQLRSPETVVPVVEDANAIITQYACITEKVINSLRHCEVIVRYGIGINNVDIQSAARKGIYVCNVPDYGIEEVSDHAIAMMLGLGKKISVLTNAFKNGEWGYGSIIPVLRFRECVVGLIGFGRIAQMVARKLSGFGVSIKAYDPYGNKDIADSLGVQMVGMDEIYETCDFVSVHCPLTQETQHMIDETAFEKMKKTAFFINTSRGAVVNEQDLVEALQKHKIAGCGIDVFENEPVEPDHPLLCMENVIATPHCAWYSETAIKDLQKKAAEEAVSVLKGHSPVYCVNKELI